MEKIKSLAAVLEMDRETPQEDLQNISLSKTCLGTSTANKLKLVQINNHPPSSPSWDIRDPRSISLPWQCFRNQQQKSGLFAQVLLFVCRKNMGSSNMGSLCSFLAILFFEFLNFTRDITKRGRDFFFPEGFPMEIRNVQHIFQNDKVFNIKVFISHHQTVIPSK